MMLEQVMAQSFGCNMQEAKSFDAASAANPRASGSQGLYPRLQIFRQCAVNLEGAIDCFTCGDIAGGATDPDE